MQKNVASQRWIVYAYEDEGGTNPGEPVTGDALNITANLRIDGGAANAVDDTNPTELEDGFYSFDITAAESNGDNIVICPASSTANVNVVGAPAVVYTTPPNFPDFSITAAGRVDVDAISGTTQTANDVGNDVNAILTDTGYLQTQAAAGTYDTATGFATPTNITAGTITTTTNLTNLPSIPANWLTDTGINAGAITAAKIATDAIDADAIATDAVTEIQSGLATSAEVATVDANVDTMVAGLITGAAQTGTLSTTQATTDLTGYTDDQMIGRTLTWTSGVCDGEQTDITDYAQTNGLLTYTLMTLAPGNGDTFKIS